MKNKFKRGINLGGWFSQYNKWDRRHFSSFITGEDFVRIAKWGFDHVRMPVDYTLFMTEEGETIQEGYTFMDKGINYAIENGLGIILDLHRAPGYHLADMLGNDLFANRKRQELYLLIWIKLTERYKKYGDELRFELLNEAQDTNPYRPNKLMQKTIGKIREADRERVLIIGGINYNHVDSLSQIWVNKDERIIYNFHYYDPNPFTNQGYQKVHDLPGPRYDKILSYPGDFPEYDKYLKVRPELAEEYGKFAFLRNDRDFMEKNIKKASDFMEYYGRQVYCGEFGVVFYAREEDRVGWVWDLVKLMDEAGIGWAYWTYKGMDYGLVDEEGNVYHEELIDILKA